MSNIYKVFAITLFHLIAIWGIVGIENKIGELQVEVLKQRITAEKELNLQYKQALIQYCSKNWWWNGNAHFNDNGSIVCK